MELLERDVQLTQFRAALGAAAAGDGQLLLLEGAAGIGKTRLLGAAAAEGRDAGFTVLRARAGEFESAFAFGVVRQLFEAPLAALATADRAAWLNGAATLAEPLFAVTATDAVDESPFAMLHGLYWLAANAALATPTLLAIDDAHWCDEPSLRWLVYLARRIEGLPLLVLVATRAPDQGPHAELVGELLADPAAARIHIDTLGEASAAELARRRFGTAPAPAFAAALHSGSGGNPLYLTALLDAVAREQIEPTAEQAPRVLELGPESVSREVTARLSHLPGDAAQTLRAAAVLGDGTRLPLVAALTALGALSTAQAASDLVDAGLLATADPIEFEHPVVRSAVIAAMRTSDRLIAQRRAAEIIVDSGGRPQQAATYLIDTLPDDDRFVVATLRAAAATSVAQGASESAIAYLRRALAEPPSRDELPDVLHELGSAQLNTGAPDAPDALRASVVALDSAARRPDLVLAYARSLILLGDMSAAVELLSQTTDAADGLPAAARAQLEAHVLMAAQHDPALREMTERLVASATGDNPLLLSALASEAARHGDDRGATISLASRALAAADPAERDSLLLILHALWPLTVAGEESVAAQGYARAIDAARQRGDLFSVSALSVFRGGLRVRTGELLAAEEDLQPTGHLGEQDDPSFRLYRAVFLAEAQLERGRLDAARALLAGPFTVDLPVHRSYSLYVVGRVAMASNRTHEALDTFLALGEIARSLGVANPAWVPWRSAAALVHHQLGQTDAARALAGDELVAARRWGAPRALGMALRAAGLVGSDIDALREAVDVLAPSAARVEHARALIDLGAALRRSNSRKEAREFLRAGVDLAHECGATVVADLGNEELAATGARPRSAMLTGRDNLTASERRVAQLALDGLSNKDIAQSLFVTVKTVEVHLSRVYRKLDISSRHELSAELLGAT